MSKYLENLRARLRVLASPHYYHRRSSWLLFVSNFLQFLGFLKTKRPDRNSLNELKKLKNSKIGRTALVLASGPSADGLNHDFLEHFVDDVLVINGFNKLKIAEKIKPVFYGLSDPAHLKDLSGKQESERQDLLTYVKKVGATLFLPHSAYESKFFNEFKCLFFDDRELTFFNNSINPTKPRGYGSTTIYKMLALACFLNYDKIYILGIDNTNFYNYRGTPDNRIIDVGLNTAESSDSSRSSFISEYETEFTSGIAGRMQSYSHLFGDLNKFPKNKIINLDPNSLLDVFPKLLD